MDFQSYVQEIGEIGYVTEVIQTLISVDGLPTARLDEMVLFETGEIGQVIGLGTKYVEIIAFSKHPIRVGTRVVRLNKLLSIPVGNAWLGKTIDPLGSGLMSSDASQVTLAPVDAAPLGIASRARINKPFETGVLMVDLLVPLGKGQRELVIGDRKTGKSNFLLQVITSQAKQGTICIFAAIGKKRLEIKRLEEFLRASNIMPNAVIVASDSQDPPGLIFLTPFAAMTIAEYFRDQGKDVLVVLDDLNTHAKIYREIALISKRFPGRNSYPADIFYTHARLLERAGNFAHGKGEVSITCLPVAETVQGDLAGYIQTNIISMTDGHLYFDNEMFTKGRRPAVNPFLSVTRVGRQTQSNPRHEINREVMSFLTLAESTERFIHFGAEASESVKNTIATAEKMYHFFDQPSSTTIPANLGVFLFVMLWAGVWQEKSTPVMKGQIGKIIAAYDQNETFKRYVNDFNDRAGTFNEMIGNIHKVLDVMSKQGLLVGILN